MPRDLMNLLPAELTFQIATYLDANECFKMMVTCRQMYLRFKGPILCKQVILRTDEGRESFVKAMEGLSCKVRKVIASYPITLVYKRRFWVSSPTDSGIDLAPQLSARLRALLPRCKFILNLQYEDGLALVKLAQLQYNDFRGVTQVIIGHKDSEISDPHLRHLRMSLNYDRGFDEGEIIGLAHNDSLPHLRYIRIGRESEDQSFGSTRDRSFRTRECTIRRDYSEWTHSKSFDFAVTGAYDRKLLETVNSLEFLEGRDRISIIGGNGHNPSSRQHWEEFMPGFRSDLRVQILDTAVPKPLYLGSCRIEDPRFIPMNRRMMPCKEVSKHLQEMLSCDIIVALACKLLFSRNRNMLPRPFATLRIVVTRGTCHPKWLQDVRAKSPKVSWASWHEVMDIEDTSRSESKVVRRDWRAMCDAAERYSRKYGTRIYLGNLAVEEGFLFDGNFPPEIIDERRLYDDIWDDCPTRLAKQENLGE